MYTSCVRLLTIRMYVDRYIFLCLSVPVLLTSILVASEEKIFLSADTSVHACTEHLTLLFRRVGLLITNSTWSFAGGHGHSYLHYVLHIESNYCSCFDSGQLRFRPGRWFSSSHQHRLLHHRRDSTISPGVIHPPQAPAKAQSICCISWRR